NIELENTTSDIVKVFGANSPEAAESQANPDLAVADFEGIVLHCAQNSLLCGGSKHARPDKLPDEPGGYNTFQALFGNKYLAPALNKSSSIVINDLDGNPIADQKGNPGFPGFDPTPSQTLGYLAAMLEAGVPVVYGYIEDAHDNNNNAFPSNPDGAFGPGEADYVAQLKKFDSAFGKFFTRLATDGFTPANTLFVITADENDHFAGGPPTPAGCGGINVACTYPNKGEVTANLNELFLGEFGDKTSFNIDFDDAPGIWIDGNPGQTSSITRALEREAAGLRGLDQVTGHVNQITKALADHAEQALLHMITSDPNRTPNFILFANPDYFLQTVNPAAPCTQTTPGCFTQDRTSDAWNHGDFQDEITHTWLGLVGPGVSLKGRTDNIFSDHTDIRPTIMSLAGLVDDYAHDGRVLFEVLKREALPDSLRDNQELLSRLAASYKQINAPLGKLGLKTLTGISSLALTGDNATYTALEDKIADLTKRRNEIAGKMITMLENAAFHGQEINEEEAEHLIGQAENLLKSVD
ncbi:MAG TPA: hypothetical protein VHT02_08475, partial [Methylocella sp.]|nr:hypothetical protein [Methylocella sp.]